MEANAGIYDCGIIVNNSKPAEVPAYSRLTAGDSYPPQTSPDGTSTAGAFS